MALSRKHEHESRQGACTGFMGGPGSHFRTESRVGVHRVHREHDQTASLPRTSSPSGDDDSLMNFASPGSYRARGSGHILAGVDFELLPVSPRGPAPPPLKTRFICKEGGEELLQEQAEERPPRGRSTAPVVLAAAITPHKKTVTWNPSLTSVAFFEKWQTSSCLEGGFELPEPQPRLPSSPAAESKEKCLHLPKSSGVVRLPSVRLPSERLSGGVVRCSQKELRLLTPAIQQDTADTSPKPRLPSSAASMLRWSTAPLIQQKVRGPDFMLLLDEVGLLDHVWPAERVLMGMCVNQRLRSELGICPKVVISVRPGRDIPADAVLQKCRGTFSVCADVKTPAPAPSQLTRSIKSFMKSLLETDDEVLLGADPSLSVCKSKGVLPVARLRSIRHRICTLDLENCGVGADGGMGVSSLLYTHQYRNKRCNAQDTGVLQELSLARNHISTAPALFSAICSLPNLRLLDLSHNRLGTAGCKVLSDVLVKCHSLVGLDLSDNAMHDEGFAHVCVALPHLAMLCRLAATSNSIADAGASSLALVLPHAASLVEVDLCSNLVSEEGQWTLAAARVTCRLARSSRLVNLDMRRFLHFHPLGGPSHDPDWCFLCYSSDKCTCLVLNQDEGTHM